MIGQIIGLNNPANTGSILSQNANIGATILFVDDVSDFADSGQLQIGTEIIEYETVFDDDNDSVYLSLTVALASNYLVGQEVYIYPLLTRRIAKIQVAEKVLESEVDSSIAQVGIEVGDNVIVEGERVVALTESNFLFLKQYSYSTLATISPSGATKNIYYPDTYPTNDADNEQNSFTAVGGKGRLQLFGSIMLANSTLPARLKCSLRIEKWAEFDIGNPATYDDVGEAIFGAATSQPIGGTKQYTTIPMAYAFFNASGLIISGQKYVIRFLVSSSENQNSGIYVTRRNLTVMSF